MKFLLSWLKEFIELSLPPVSLADRLTLAGLEVTSQSPVEGDWIFEAEVTPNRPDLLSHLGIARETAATLGRPFRFPRWLQREFRVPALSGEPFPVRVENAEDCPVYVGWVIEGVRVGPSPTEWVQRLNRMGVRPVNNVVDMTNLCLFELGQPLHAFDLDRLEGSSVVVRRARAGERIETLDAVTRPLTPELLVIADSRKPVALAGVVGGKNTEITAATRRIFLESACFRPVLIRRATRIAKVSSESSYRFERGVDPEMVPAAALRAARWIARVAGGTLRSQVQVRAEASARPPIVLKPKKAEELLGIKLSAAQQKRYLEHLGCAVKESGRGLRVDPPSWRSDLKIPEDLYEELARLFGYDRCPTSLPPLPRQAVRKGEPPEDPRIKREGEMRQLLTAAGYQEILTYSILSPEAIARCGARPAFAIRNPLSAELACLRPTLLPGALTAVSLNIRRKSAGAFLFFEMGRIFSPGEGSSEKKFLSLLAAGTPDRAWGAEYAPLGIFHLKGAVQLLSERFGWGPLSEKEESVPGLQSGSTLAFARGGDPWGCAGSVSPEILSSFEIPADWQVAYAEFDLEKMIGTSGLPLRVKALPRFPAVLRDLALEVPEAVTYRQLQEAILQAGLPLLQEATLFDLYRGKQIPAGKKSLAFRLSFSDPERTLTEDEATTSVHRILISLQDRFQTTLRSS